MSNVKGIGYRKRLVVLGVVAALLVTVMWKKKVGPTLDAWTESRAQQAEAMNGLDIGTALHNAKARLHALDERIGGSATHGWRPVLDVLEREGSTRGVKLAAVSAEHRMDEDGLHIRTLPVGIQGRTADIVNAIATLEGNAPGVHLIGIDLGARESGYRLPRTLVATLYLQTVQP